jgi:hypothetical protein
MYPNKMVIVPRKLQINEYKKAVLTFYTSSADALKTGVGRNSGFSTPVTPAPLPPLSSSLLALSSSEVSTLTPHCISSSAKAERSLPTSVVVWKFTTTLI